MVKETIGLKACFGWKTTAIVFGELPIKYNIDTSSGLIHFEE